MSQGLTVEMMIEKAAELFAKNGYKSTSLNDVAKELNVTKPALYYHFKNKHEILTSILDVIMNIYLQRASTIQKLNIAPEQKLEKLIESHILAVIENKNFSIIFFSEQNELEDLAKKTFHLKIQQYENIFKSAIQDAIEDNTIKDINVHALVMGIFGMTNWVYNWYDENGNLSPTELVEIYTKLLQTGFLK